MKTLLFSLAAVGLFLASALAHFGAGSTGNAKSRYLSSRTKAAHVQGQAISPTCDPFPVTRPSAFGGEKGTLWALTQTVRNQ